MTADLYFLREIGRQLDVQINLADQARHRVGLHALNGGGLDLAMIVA